MLFFIFILFFIITLSYLLIYSIKCEYFQNKIKYINNTPTHSTNTYCLLLTTYNIPDRQHIYKNIIEKWLKHTNFTIFVVDSSGNKINIEHPRLHNFSFTQDDTKYYKNKDGPTEAEKNSIIKAIHFFNKKLLDYDIIIKITGKYFIPQLENLIQYIPNDVDIIFQYRNNNILKMQNSEIVGIRSKKILYLMKLIENMLFENMLYNRIQDNRFKIYKLPKLEIENTIKRNDGSVLTYL